MASPPLRIAILECDTALPNTRAKYGGYGGLFKQLLTRAAASFPPDTPAPHLALTVYDVVTAQSYPDPATIDAVLLTGSKHDAWGDAPWVLQLVEYVRRLLAFPRHGARSTVKVIGVCFGHQIVGRALRAPVGRSEPEAWEISCSSVELSARGREVFYGAEGDAGDALSIYQMHRDVVRAYPEGVEALGRSDACEVQGMYAPGRAITVQGHPEFDEEIERELLAARLELGIFGDEVVEEALGRVGKQHDGVRVARAFLRFVMEG